MIINRFTTLNKIINVCKRFYLLVNGCTWLYLIVNGCTWLYMIVNACTRLYMVVHLCIIHFSERTGGTRLSIFLICFSRSASSVQGFTLV